MRVTHTHQYKQRHTGVWVQWKRFDKHTDGDLVLLLRRHRLNFGRQKSFTTFFFFHVSNHINDLFKNSSDSEYLRGVSVSCVCEIRSNESNANGLNNSTKFYFRANEKFSHLKCQTSAYLALIESAASSK